MNEDNDERIIEVENMFGLSGIPLRQMDRKLIGEGILMKMCRKKPKERHFFLFSDILVYGSIVVHGRKLVGQHIIEIEDVEILDLQDDLIPYFGFCVKSPKKSFAMYAVSTEEKEQWINHLKKCSEECSKKRGLVGLSAAKSPVWIPDAMAPKCMVCRLTVFTVLNRRHHCRHCGVVVCSSCSLKRWLLPYQSVVPVRVCDSCYEQLKTGNEYISPRYPYVPTKNSVDDYISETSSEDSDYDENQSINLLNLTNPNISQIVLLSNFLRVAALNSVGDFILLLGKLCVSFASAGVSVVVFMRRDDLYFYPIPVIVVAVIAFFFAHCILSIYETILDVLLICYCVEEESGVKMDAIDSAEGDLVRSESHANLKKNLIIANDTLNRASGHTKKANPETEALA